MPRRSTTRVVRSSAIPAMKYALVCATAAGGLSMAQPALAQSDPRIEAIEREIKSLQAQLGQVKADLAARDRALRSAQEQAKAARAEAQAASERAGQAAAMRSPPPLAGVGMGAVTTGPIPPVASAAPGNYPAEAPGPPLPKGAIRIGPVTVTLGGFAAAEGVFRPRNEAGTVDTNFNAIPLPNSPNFHIPEYRETAQQSRFSLMMEGNIDSAQKMTGYLETDFLSAGTSSNSNESNSYTLRLRQFWGNYDNTDLGLHVLGGQAWSLATMYKVGLVPRQENVPLTIDAQYAVGFDWARQAQVRVAKEFADHKIWAGLSVEEPQTLFSSPGGPNCLTGAQALTATGGGTLEFTQCGGSNVNTIQAYSDNIAPDIIAKIAADPGWGHYELYGLLRFLGGRVSFPGTGKNYWTTGQGIGGGMILPLVPKVLDFQLSGLIGQGVGRYGTVQLPDVTFAPNGKIEPLAQYSILGGFVAHPISTVDIYAYGGAEGVASKTFAGTAGYGNPNVNLAGCTFELGTCAAVTSSVVEGTVGAWWRFFSGGFGTVQAGAQYAYVRRNTFQGVGSMKGTTLSPSTDENMVLFSLRYIPFQ
jgi:hypothetical protein